MKEIYIDIGTTTVAAMNDRGDTVSIVNPQKIYGTDVVSRLESVKRHGFEPLREVLINALNEIIYDLSCGRPDELSTISVSANTAMSSIFANVDPLPLASFPYTVNEKFGKRYSACALGINAPNASVFVCRCLSAFCGGDVLSGVIAADLDKTAKSFFYVDIGTNGEMVCSSAKRTLYSSAAAGPALEGGNIGCGASGVNGAVNRIDGIDYSDGAVRLSGYSVIGGGEAVTGLCGSALVDLLALLKINDYIDEFGTLKCRVELPCGMELTQDDVCAVQLAKSAVRSGIECLLDACSLTDEDVDEVIVAGIMGAKIDMKNACEIGLFPDGFGNKAVSYGNMALKGAAVMSDGTKVTRAEEFAKKAKKLPLSGNKRFEELFAEHILI